MQLILKARQKLVPRIGNVGIIARLRATAGGGSKRRSVGAAGAHGAKPLRKGILKTESQEVFYDIDVAAETKSVHLVTSPAIPKAQPAIGIASRRIIRILCGVRALHGVEPPRVDRNYSRRKTCNHSFGA